jgi:hypothetical protein
MRVDLTWPLAISRRTNTLCGQSVPQDEVFIFRWKLTLKLDHLSQALQTTYALTSLLDPPAGADHLLVTLFRSKNYQTANAYSSSLRATKSG